MGKIFVLDDQRIEQLLASALVGRIACAAPSIDGGRPYLVPLAYGYDGDAVYAAGPIGRKIRIMREQPLVSFEVDQADAEDRWQSVVAEGTYEELTDVAERQRGLGIIHGAGHVPDASSSLIVYRLVLTSKSGRFELPDDEAAAYNASL